MRAIRNIMIFCIIGLLIGVGSSASIKVNVLKNSINSNDSNLSMEDSFRVALYNPHSKEKNEYIIGNISEEDVKIIEKTFSLDCPCNSTMSEKFEILRKYKIIPESLTNENLSTIFNKFRLLNYKYPLNTMAQTPNLYDLNNNDPPKSAYVNYGPHLFVYASIGTVALSQPIIPTLAGFIPNITWTKHISEVIPILDTYFPSAWISNYIFLSAAHLIVGSSMGGYLSIGVAPQTNYYHRYPFLALYFPMASWGVYIYRLHPDETTNTPYLDFYMGFSLFSIQVTDPFS